MSEGGPALPLVDGPIADLVARVLADDAELAALVASPRRRLAFRTFAAVRAGLVLGELLVDRGRRDEEAAWVDAVLADPESEARVVAEIRAVAHEVASDASLGDHDAADPGPTVRERFLRSLPPREAGGRTPR